MSLGEIMITTDVSGSMGSLIDTVYERTIEFAQEHISPYAYQTGVARFGWNDDHYDTLQYPTSDPYPVFEAIKTARDNLSGGSEDTYLAIDKSIDTLITHTNDTRRILILVVDEAFQYYGGGASHSEFDIALSHERSAMEKLKSRIQNYGIEIFVICASGAKDEYTKMMEYFYDNLIPHTGVTVIGQYPIIDIISGKFRSGYRIARVGDRIGTPPDTYKGEINTGNSKIFINKVEVALEGSVVTLNGGLYKLENNGTKILVNGKTIARQYDQVGEGYNGILEGSDTVTVNRHLYDN